MKSNSITIQHLKAGHDPFLVVTELPQLYSWSSAVGQLEDELLDLVTHEEPRLRDRVQLGLIYAKRFGNGERYQDILDEIDTIGERAATDVGLSRLVRIVRAVLVLSRGERYAEGLSLLEEIHQELRYGESGPLYGFVRRWMGSGHMGLAQNLDAERAFQDAISVCRRYGLRCTYAAALNDYAVLKKRLGAHAEARALFRQVISEFSAIGSQKNVLMAHANLGLVSLRIGDWPTAEKQLARARGLLLEESDENAKAHRQLKRICDLNALHLRVLRRSFDGLEAQLVGLARDTACVTPRATALSHEFLGEFYHEVALYDKAAEQFRAARDIAKRVFPESDVMTEVLRREAQVFVAIGEYGNARLTAKTCIGLAMRVGDRYELGAAERVLGEAYMELGEKKRAHASLAAAVRTLRDLGDCYELMRTLYAQGKFLSSQDRPEDAEVALLEARQLAKKLELDYYQALIGVALVDTLGPQERFDEANTWLNEATALRDNLEGIDRERVEDALKRAAGELQVAMTRASVRSAEVLKTICRVYEDARFPFEDLKPDLAYQVAQSVGGECLFVIGRRGGGYHVPLTYNIAVNEAKEIVRQMDRGPRKTTLLDVKSEPRILNTSNGKTLVAVPCRHEGSDRRDPTSYVLCTRFDTIVTITPRQLELLGASAEALARLIEDEEERRGSSGGSGEEDTIRVRHPRGSFKDIQTIDPDMIKVIRTAERAATSVAPILLEGETGVGKELFARAIHATSRRKDATFVAVNAGGLSVHLIESELFGHVKGAFTGANGDRVGLIETARGGTLFLDEIGEMSEELQVKLLRLLENGEYRRLGESAVRQADVRIISATNRDLKKEVDRGAFRRDLFYRVSPIRLTIPPLRLRSRDIQLLVRHFLRDCAALNGIADRYIEIDVKAMEALELYDWPGNVRELYNEILRVVSLIGRGDLVKFAMLSDNIKDYLKSKNRGDGLLDRSVEQYERRLILNALDKNDWNRMRTADSVGVPRTTLLAKLKRLNVATK